VRKIEYTEHLKIRIKLRRIPPELPRDIFLTADERYYDSWTQHRIALKKMEYLGKKRIEI